MTTGGADATTSEVPHRTQNFAPARLTSAHAGHVAPLDTGMLGNAATTGRPQYAQKRAPARTNLPHVEQGCMDMITYLTCPCDTGRLDRDLVNACRGLA